jgi:CRISPR-associated protein (TIGR02584 family)
MKNILLAVVGLSPQVVTETLYALHQQGRQVDSIEIITTRQGKEMIHARLLASEEGRFHRYLADYGIDPALKTFLSIRIPIGTAPFIRQALHGLMEGELLRIIESL